MKRIASFIGIAVVVLLLAVVSLPFLIDANRFRPRLESELTKALGRDVKVGDLKLAILSGGVTADDLSIADDPAYSHAPFLHTKSMTLGVDLPTLVFSRKLHVQRLLIDQPQIALIQSASGDWNFSSLGGKSTASPRPSQPSGEGLDLSVKLVKITGGRVTLGQLHSSARSPELDKVNIELLDFGAGSVSPFTLSASFGGGGDIQLSGNAGPINPGNAAQTPVKVRVKLSQFNLAAAGVGTSGGLAGLLSLDGVGSSNGSQLYLNGRLKAEQLKLAKNGSPAREPVQFDFALEHDMRRRVGMLRRGEIHIGSAPASLTGTYAQHGEALVLNMNLSGPQMPVPQLAAMLPALGIVLPTGSSLEGGTANAKLAFEGPAEFLVTSGSLGLRDTRLTGFDLGSKISTVERLAGIKTGPNTDIQVLSANVRLAPEGSTVQDIKLVAPAMGELSGNGTISPSHALAFKMHATLHTSGGVMDVLGQTGDTGVPFVVEGTASNPVFRPDVKGLATEEIKNFSKGNLGKTATDILGGLLGKKKQ